MHGGLIWYYKKAHGALFQILVVEIPTDVGVKPIAALNVEAYIWINFTRRRDGADSGPLIGLELFAQAQCALASRKQRFDRVPATKHC